jgi:hypothetical protein
MGYVLACVTITVVPVDACQICVPYPKTTIADLLMKADAVVMARENPEKQYFFYTVEILKGTVDEDEFEAFVNSATRRKLKQNPEDAVVFVRQNGEGAWTFITYADTHYKYFIRAIIKNAADWGRLRDSKQRINFFAEKLSDNHAIIREQAYLEVGRAPYASIKRIANTVPREQIRQFLNNWRLVEWHNLFILMLGQSRHPDDRTYIRDKMETAARFGLTNNLSAWATAYIEAFPATGLEEISSLYFETGGRTTQELEQICTTLSVLGSEASVREGSKIVDRRRRIINSYAILLDHHPKMAEWVAKDLTAWRIQALVDQLTAIRDHPSMPSIGAILTLDYYLSAAQNFPKLGSHP